MPDPGALRERLIGRSGVAEYIPLVGTFTWRVVVAPMLMMQDRDGPNGLPPPGWGSTGPFPNGLPRSLPVLANQSWRLFRGATSLAPNGRYVLQLTAV